MAEAELRVVMRRLVGPRERQRRWIVLAPTVVLALWAGWWVTIKTQESTKELWVDSSVYLSTASSLRASGEPTVAFTVEWDGFTPRQAVGFHGRAPATHFPPGYPAALATTSFIAGSVRGAARALDVVLIAVNILLLGLLTARMTRYRSVVVATLPAVLLLFTSDYSPTDLYANFGWMPLHLTTASEPLFTALFMVGLLALSVALADRDPRAKRWLMVAVGAWTAALLTRYIGIALVLAAVVALVALDRRRRLGLRLRRAGVFAAVAVAPTVLFVGWAVIRGSGSPRPIFFHPLASSLRLPFVMFARYLFPPGGPEALRVLAIMLVIVLVVVGAVRGPALVGEASDDDRASRLLAQLGLLSIATYVIVLIITRTSFDVHTPINLRLLAPIRGVFYAVVVAVAYRTLAHVARRIASVAIIATLVAVVVAGGWAQQREILHMPREPRTTPNSVDEAIARLPRNTLFVSNVPGAVYTSTGRGSIALPETHVFLSGELNPDYGRELRELVRILKRRGGYLVAADFVGRRLGHAFPAELRRSLEFRLVARFGGQNPALRLYRIFPAVNPP